MNKAVAESLPFNRTRYGSARKDCRVISEIMRNPPSRPGIQHDHISVVSLTCSLAVLISSALAIASPSALSSRRNRSKKKGFQPPQRPLLEPTPSSPNYQAFLRNSASVRTCQGMTAAHARNKAYEGHCCLRMKNNERDEPWRNPGLKDLKKDRRPLFNRARMNRNWDLYRSTLTRYNN